MIKTSVLLVSMLAVSAPAIAGEKLVTVASTHPVKASLDKLETIAQAKGFKVFARVDHAAGAQSVGQPLRPTELLIVGNPKGGTPLMQCTQTFGIDLPLHVLAWQDEQGKTWLGYKDLAKLGHKLTGESCKTAVDKVAGALAGLVAEAAR